jgi:hypothetical protein
MNDDLRPDLPVNDLRDGLRGVADHVAFTVPDLLPRARAARRRRRVVGTTATAAVVVAAVALMPPLFDTSRAVPAAPTSTPAPSGSPAPTSSPSGSPTPSPRFDRTGPATALPVTGEPGPVVAHEEIVARCQSQLTRSVAVFGPVPDDLRVARDRDYREGDVVRLVSDSGWDPAALCLVPEKGTEPPPLDLSLDRQPADPENDPYLMQVCSELYTRVDANTGARGYDTVDLRAGRPVAQSWRTGASEHSSLGDLRHLFVSLGEQTYRCGWAYQANGALRVLANDPLGARPTPPTLTAHVGDAFWDGTSATADLVVWGYLPRDVADVTFTGVGLGDSSVWWRDGDGIYLVIAQVAPTGTAESWAASGLTVTALDEDGTELESQPVTIGSAVAEPANLDGGSPPITADYTLGVGFGETDALSRTSEGQDFTAPADTPVHAVAAGIVLDAVDDPWFGTNVVIRHDNGDSTLYAHLSGSSVSPGDAVEAGQLIGTVGMTGRAFEPHLHLRYYGPGLTPGGSDASDPLAFLRSLGVEVG